MPRLSFENCVKVTRPDEKLSLEDKEFFNVKFIVKKSNDKFRSFHCNKFALAAASPVFNKQFFGSLKKKLEDENQEEKEEVINVEDVSMFAFNTFLQLLFLNEAVDPLQSVRRFRSLFEVLKIADMYCVEDVKNLVVKRIETHVISEDNILAAVNLTTEYGHLLPFESVCESLMTRCCRSVGILWPTTQNFLFFCAENKKYKDLLNFLFTKVKNQLG